MIKQIRLKLPSPFQKLSFNSDNGDVQISEQHELWCKRDDLIHPIISGNKWRKLAYTFATHDEIAHIISYGGGFSNHLHALGYICYREDISFTARIRGDYQAQPTPMIKDLVKWGAHIEYMNKQAFKEAREQTIQSFCDGVLIIPEGGFSQAGLDGVSVIIDEMLAQHAPLATESVTLVVPVATGTTLAGLIKRAPAHWYIQGIAVLKGQTYLEQNVASLVGESCENWSIEHDFHAGGYAKCNSELEYFLDQWDHKSCPIEPVYSGKAVWGLYNLIRQQKINSKHIIYLHTGGLQGARKP